MEKELESTNILRNIFWSGTAMVCTYQEITHFQMTWNNLGWPVITRSVTINDSKRTLKPDCEKVKWSKSKRSHQSGTHGKTTPWFAPGTAPVYGACGTLGGWEIFSDFVLGGPWTCSILGRPWTCNISRWPEGCHHDGKGHFGDCCSGNCDGFALGKNAEEYDWPGEIPVTEWFAGSFQV